MTTGAKAAWIGLSLCTLAALGASSGGVFVRAVGQENEWAVLFYRSAAFCLVIVAYLALSGARRGAIRGLRDQMRRPDVLAAAAFLGLAFIFYVVAMNRTTVGNVLLILSAAPFSIALMRRLLFGASISGATWACMALGGAGVVLVVAGGETVSLEPGIAYALAATLCYSGFVVCLGLRGGGDFMGSLLLAGLMAAGISAAVATAIAPPALLDVRRDVVLYAASMGVFQLGVQYILMTRAADYVPPETISLVLLLEVVLGPIWVWAVFAETLDRAALLAFPLILAAAVGNAVFGGAGLRGATARRRPDPSRGRPAPRRPRRRS